MGIRVRPGSSERVAIRLEKMADETTRQLRRVQETSARDIAEIAAEMAPYKTGELEGSVEIREARDARGRKASEIVAAAPHAIYMHEGFYDLGPDSLAKQNQVRRRVGRKFLARAVDEVLPSLVARSRAAVREGVFKALRGISRRNR